MASKKERIKTPENEINIGWKKSLLLYMHDLFSLMILILLTFLLIFRLIIVKGDSMKMTLLDGDYLLLLSNTFYQEPEYGDIVVISKDSFDNGAPIVKRVIATEGQVVDIDFHNGIVYVDGEALKEPYINNLTINEEGTTFPLVVEENSLFVLGDNRQVSKDSRSPEIGLIDKREVLGKAIFLIWPGDDQGDEVRDINRIGVIE